METLKYLTAVCLHILLSGPTAQHGSNIVEDFKVSNTGHNNVNFTNHILFSFNSKDNNNVRSLLDCARRCTTDDGCKAFTFVTRDGSCQGYAIRMESGDPSVPLRGARTYMIPIPPIPDWLNTACGTHTDCVNKIPELELYASEQLPVCFRDRCLCTLGYFYSVNHKLCVQECLDSDLQSTYTMYPDSGIHKNNDYTLQGNVDQCKEQCNSISDCENFETPGGFCYASDTSSGPGVVFDTSAASWKYYQRDCV